MKKRNFLTTQEQQPRIRSTRSKFDLSFHHKTTFDEGDLVPCYLQEVYPGDTFDCKTAFAIRTTNPFIRVPMDNLFMDIYYFFVPNRLLYDKWKNVMGENSTGYWKPSTLPEVPYCEAGDFDYDDVNAHKKKYAKSIANYFGIPIDGAGIHISDLPFRAYALIWNEWFRDENLQEPVNINFGDNYPSHLAYTNIDAFSVTNYHGLVAKVNKLHDYFTSCLPEPQKGAAISIPFEANTPVYTGEAHTVGTTSLLFNDGNGNPITQSGTLGLGVGELGFATGAFTPSLTGLHPSNLYAKVDLGNINDLRFAFQMQKLLEKDARGGTRYREYLQAHFNVISPDARMQIPEFLGGKRIPLDMQQVTQTSASTTDSPLGQVSAYSLSNGSAYYNKAFVEHGFVVGLMCVRQYHTYQQGIERFWFRKKRTDFYDPVFANIGEQPVYGAEIQAGKYDTFDEVIFGYNEAWADLRYRFSRITGALNSGLQQGLDTWHFGDYYSAATNVKLDSEFIEETSEYLDRCLSAPSSTIPNFVIDMLHKQTAIRVMPTYSIPGYADHH